MSKRHKKENNKQNAVAILTKWLMCIIIQFNYAYVFTEPKLYDDSPRKWRNGGFDLEGNGKRMTVSEIIFEEMKERIVAGEWKPGERIPSENKLCQHTGASRVTVRAAIQKLSSLGLVESKRGGGTFVCELSGEQHLNSVIPYFALSQPDRASMFEFRRIIEVEGAALAALRADAEQISAMYKATEMMAAAETTEEITKYDLEFHYLIMKGSRNSILIKVFEILEDTYFSLLHENVTRLGSTGAAFHQMITVAIESRDGELAKLLMEKHLNNAIHSLAGIRETESDADISAR